MKFLRYSLINSAIQQFAQHLRKRRPLYILGGCALLILLTQLYLFFSSRHQQHDIVHKSLNFYVSARSEQGVPVAGAKIWVNNVLLGATGSFGVWEGSAVLPIGEGGLSVTLQKGEGKNAMVRKKLVAYDPKQIKEDTGIKVSFLTPPGHPLN